MEKFQRMMRDSKDPDVPNELNAYLRRGQHHMRWAKDDRKRMSLIDGVVRYCAEYPDVRLILIEHLQRWCEDDLRKMLHSLTCFELPHPFTQQRADFVAFITLIRRQRLLQALEN